MPWSPALTTVIDQMIGSLAPVVRALHGVHLSFHRDAVELLHRPRTPRAAGVTSNLYNRLLGCLHHCLTKRVHYDENVTFPIQRKHASDSTGTPAPQTVSDQHDCRRLRLRRTKGQPFPGRPPLLFLEGGGRRRFTAVPSPSRGRGNVPSRAPARPVAPATEPRGGRT